MGFTQNPEITMLWMDVRKAEELIRQAQAAQLAADKAREGCLQYARDIDIDIENHVMTHLERVASESPTYHPLALAHG